nr:hypothetical protein [Tanacetum cinerariifolium]
MSYLSDFKEFDGGYVTFGGEANGGRITSKGTLKTGKLDFEDVYFVKELKFNLLSVSPMCDKKYSVLFTDTGCFVLSLNFKLTDESQVLLKVPRRNNMYIVDIKNIVPKESLTSLVTNATLDESMLCHRRLGYINFKNINKLVKDKLLRGLPSKHFENDQTCVACLKGKKHKESCKFEIQNSISQLLFMLHMDLFGPTFMSSLMHKTYGYGLVVTDDYSIYNWVFFLASKNETTGILKKFITEIENLVNKKVKVIRCDNGTEFKNSVMNDFYAMKVNTACYVQNRALVVKPYNKTPYELFRGRTPALSFMRSFGYHVTILNTLEHLGKLDGKANKGYFVGYSMNSKAFRVYNIRTKRVEKNLHIEFLENKTIVTGARPEWLFDIHMLTKSMIYVPVIAGTNSDDFASTKDSIGAGQSNMETRSTQDYIYMPLWKDGSPLFDYSPNLFDDAESPSYGDDGKKLDEVLDKESGASNKLNSAFENLNTEYPYDPKMPGLETIATNDDSEEEADFTNLYSLIHVSPTPTTRTHKNHPLKQEEGIYYDEVFAPVARIEAIRLFLAYASFLGFMVYQMDVKSSFLYERFKEEVFVCQPPGFKDLDHPDKDYVDDIIFGSTKKDLCTEFERLMKDKFQMSFMGELTFFLGLRVKQKEDGIFISQDKYVTKVLRKFNFLDVKSANTPVDMEKSLVKDEYVDDVKQSSMVGFGEMIQYNLTSGVTKLRLLGKLTTAIDVNVVEDSQVEGRLKHKEIYVTPSHTKKFFANMKRQGKVFSGKVTPLFETMMVQPQEDMGEDSEIPNEHVTTTSNDPLSGEDRLKLTELMELYTQLQSRVLALETTNVNQALEIGSLQRREDASKQRRMIKDLDADEGVTLVDKTWGRNDQDMFDTSIFDEEEVVAEKEAKALIDIRTSKPKAKRIMIPEPTETSTPTQIDSSQQSSKAKDKGKSKMIEPEKPLKKKDQIMIDEEVVKNIEAQMQAELEEEERLARQKEEKDNITLIESWDNIQAMMDADCELAARLQEEEREE